MSDRSDDERRYDDDTGDVKVTQTASVVGLFGVNQEVLNQQVRADGNGNFSFSFSPRIPLPGTRYDVTIVASKANVTNETRLALYQR